MYKPNFIITNSILKYISQIEAAKEVIANAPLVPEFERKFQDDAVTRTVHYSTMIEDERYQLDLEDARKIVEGGKLSTFRKRDVKEIINYRNAIEHINNHSEDSLSMKLMLEIHQILMSGILAKKYLGLLRKTKVVGVSSKTSEVVFDTPNPKEVHALLDDFFNWYLKLSDEIHPIIKASIVHYEIVRIHPFVDGNGRVSRLLATFSLYKDGYDIQRFFSLEEYYDQNIESYYKAIDSVEQLGEMTWWVDFFAKGLADELKRVKEKVFQMSKDYRNRQMLGQVSLNERQILIVEFIQQHNKIQNREWQKLFPKISDDTILRDLKILIENKIVKKVGKTKSAGYVLV